MSLLKRVERAQQLAAQAAEQSVDRPEDDGSSAVATLPAAVAPVPVPSRPPDPAPVLTPASQVSTVLPDERPASSGLGRGLGGSGLGSVAVPVRSDLIRNLRFHLQDEVINAFDTLLDLDQRRT